MHVYALDVRLVVLPFSMVNLKAFNILMNYLVFVFLPVGMLVSYDSLMGSRLVFIALYK